MLVGAQGFANVSNEERFGECKSAVEQILREITSVARQWKVRISPFQAVPTELSGQGNADPEQLSECRWTNR